MHSFWNQDQTKRRSVCCVMARMMPRSTGMKRAERHFERVTKIPALGCHHEPQKKGKFEQSRPYFHPTITTSETIQPSVAFGNAHPNIT